MDKSRTNYRRKWEDRLARPMFVLAMLSLVLLSGALHRPRDFESGYWDTLEARILLGSLVLLWPIFPLEAIVRFFLRDRPDRTWRAALRSLATALFPPLRMAARSVTRPRHLWLPWVGWHEVTYDLQKTLERVFSGPMLCMALLVLPVLAVEYFWSEAVESYPALRIVLTVSVSVIWLGFTTEFIIRISAAEKKFSYAFTHWLDLAIVLLPTIEFMPFLRVLRVTRLMRLESLARLAKYYRLYGLAGKGWRGLMVLRLIQHMFSRSPKAQLSRLKSQLEEKQEEMQELERELDYYRRRIEHLEREFGEQET